MSESSSSFPPSKVPIKSLELLPRKVQLKSSEESSSVVEWGTVEGPYTISWPHSTLLAPGQEQGQEMKETNKEKEKENSPNSLGKYFITMASKVSLKRVCIQKDRQELIQWEKANLLGEDIQRQFSI